MPIKTCLSSHWFVKTLLGHLQVRDIGRLALTNSRLYKSILKDQGLYKTRLAHRLYLNSQDDRWIKTINAQPAASYQWDEEAHCWFEQGEEKTIWHPWGNMTLDEVIVLYSISITLGMRHFVSLDRVTVLVPRPRLFGVPADLFATMIIFCYTHIIFANDQNNQWDRFESQLHFMTESQQVGAPARPRKYVQMSFNKSGLLKLRYLWGELFTGTARFPQLADIAGQITGWVTRTARSLGEKTANHQDQKTAIHHLLNHIVEKKEVHSILTIAASQSDGVYTAYYLQLLKRIVRLIRHAQLPAA